MKIKKIAIPILVLCLQIAGLPAICSGAESMIVLTLPDAITLNLNAANLKSGEMLLIKAKLNNDDTPDYLNMIMPAMGNYTFRLSEPPRLNDVVRVDLAGAVIASNEFTVTDDIVCTQFYHSTGEGFQKLIDQFKEDLVGEDLTLADLNDYLNFSAQKKMKVYTRCVDVKHDTLSKFAKFMKNAIAEVKDEKETEATEYTYDKNKNRGGDGGGGGGGVGKTAAVLPDNSNMSEADDIYYSDISEIGWAIESINELTKLKIVNGMGDGQFLPMRDITRGEFVKMLIGAFGINEPNAVCPFYDVDYDSWQYPYVAAAYQLGLVNGSSELLFGVDDCITRQDAVTMIYRFLKHSKADLVSPAKPTAFSDVREVAPYAVDAVNTMSILGVINGIDGRFEPSGSCTRAMAAKMIFFAMKLV